MNQGDYNPKQRESAMKMASIQTSRKLALQDLLELLSQMWLLGCTTRGGTRI